MFSVTKSRRNTHLHVLALFVHDHHFYDEWLGMRQDRFLTNVFYKFAKFHWESFFTLFGMWDSGLAHWLISLLTFFLPTNELHSILTPWLTIETSNLWFVLNQSTISLSVGSFLNSNRSQSVHSVSPYLFFAAAMGSEKPKNGRAKLTKPFLKSSSLAFPSITWIIFQH